MSKELRQLLEQYLEDYALERGIILEHVRRDAFEIDWDEITPEEKNVVLAVKEYGRQIGSDQGSYHTGVLALTFQNKQAVSDFLDGLDLLSVVDMIDEVDVEVRGEDLPNGRVDGEYNIDDIMFDGQYEFTVYVYLVPEIVRFSPTVEIEVDDDFEFDDEEGEIYEVRRRIKVNARGKRRIKMQCRPGFKWDSAKRSCQKISGGDLATIRKSVRKMVRTKKSLGGAFKARVLRKQRRAKRFRKSMGLK